MNDPSGVNSMATVKKQIRPDWIDSENKIFINKLNFICENFDKNNEDVSDLIYILCFFRLKN
jgi:hypothetical protein